MNKLLLIPISLLIAACGHADSYSWSVSADTTRFDYAETDASGLIDTETNDFGDISGFTLAIEPTNIGLYLQTSYAKGTTDYIGGTNLSPTYGSHRTTTDNRIVDMSAGYKTTAFLDRTGSVKMPIKIGLGYREWVRDIRSTPGVSGYGEVYDWGYYDIGIGLHFALSPAVTLGADANYRKAFNAKMYENWHGYTFDLKDVHGYKITVPLEFALDRSLSTFMTYNYEYWNIGASNVINTYYEPDSETKNETLSIGLKYRY